jgi:hypothetical protein
MSGVGQSGESYGYEFMAHFCQWQSNGHMTGRLKPSGAKSIVNQFTLDARLDAVFDRFFAGAGPARRVFVNPVSSQAAA